MTQILVFLKPNTILSLNHLYEPLIFFNNSNSTELHNFIFKPFVLTPLIFFFNNSNSAKRTFVLFPLGV